MIPPRSVTPLRCYEDPSRAPPPDYGRVLSSWLDLTSLAKHHGYRAAASDERCHSKAESIGTCTAKIAQRKTLSKLVTRDIMRHNDLFVTGTSLAAKTPARAARRTLDVM
jgi:hypothetical protein